MNLILSTSAAGALMLAAAAADAADFPKTGEAEYDTYYVFNTVAKIDAEVGTGADRLRPAVRPDDRRVARPDFPRAERPRFRA